VPYVTAGFYLILFNNTNSIGKLLGVAWLITNLVTRYSSPSEI